MAHGDARVGKWRGNKRMEWVGSALPLLPRNTVYPALLPLPVDPLSSTASTRLNWLPRRFKWTRPFPWKTISGFCACAITFQMDSTCYLTNARLRWYFSSVAQAILAIILCSYFYQPWLPPFINRVLLLEAASYWHSVVGTGLVEVPTAMFKYVFPSVMNG
jgi:hypothetical protein